MKGKELKLTAKAIETLAAFEEELNPADPEAGSTAPRILGYGEMSTVFRFPGKEEMEGIAFKRMAIFETEAELAPYEQNFRKYNESLNEIGIITPDYGTVRGERKGKPVLYAYQRMVDPARIGHRYFHSCKVEEALSVVSRILERFDLIFRLNESRAGKLEYGLDGQLSNWAVAADGDVIYLDTSTPLMRVDGVEQLNVELFLRVCPSYLVWIIRLLFLKDVVNRYYDLRLVIIDLIANLHKEKLVHLIEPCLELANEFLRRNWPQIAPISLKEITAYYAEDARIWKIFLAFRRLERTIKTRIQKKEYSLILPAHIDR